MLFFCRVNFVLFFFFKLFLHLLSHYLNAAEDAAGRTVSVPTPLLPTKLCQGAGIAQVLD